MKKIMLFLIPLILLLPFCGCSPQKERITGEVEAAETDVGVKVPGRLEALFVREGDSVKKGQKLAALESKELAAKKKTAEAALKEAKEQFDFASKSYNRVKNLFDTGVLPRQQYDETKYKYEAARQKVEATQGVLNEVNAYFEELYLKAPIDGEVTGIISRAGEIVASGYPVLTLMDTSDKWITFNLREDKLPGLKKGDYVDAEIPALGVRIRAKVFYISALGAFAKWKATDELGSFDLKTFEVRARPENTMEDLRPGMSVFIQKN
ncbi:MAG: efflux RND transporter periplasmic adaptor subunit [Elusimicrobiales bacterium]|nr:efflux RND transporter periplasmic adaptor subunit [Elusimicrobiales bacterium]